MLWLNEYLSQSSRETQTGGRDFTCTLGWCYAVGLWQRQTQVWRIIDMGNGRAWFLYRPSNDDPGCVERMATSLTDLLPTWWMTLSLDGHDSPSPPPPPLPLPLHRDKDLPSDKDDRKDDPSYSPGKCIGAGKTQERWKSGKYQQKKEGWCQGSTIQLGGV